MVVVVRAEPRGSPPRRGARENHVRSVPLFSFLLDGRKRTASSGRRKEREGPAGKGNRRDKHEEERNARIEPGIDRLDYKVPSYCTGRLDCIDTFVAGK